MTTHETRVVHADLHHIKRLISVARRRVSSVRDQWRYNGLLAAPVVLSRLMWAIFGSRFRLRRVRLRLGNL